MMAKMGWEADKGRGLGKEEQGVSETSGMNRSKRFFFFLRGEEGTDE
mgnify:CR=1 FL=1